MLDNEETQGLAAIEIMACNCPIFCIDKNSFSISNKLMIGEVTSITCWSPECGFKTTLEKWKEDFPIFLKNLLSYNPADFAKSYSYRKAAINLLYIGRETMTLELEKAQSLNQTSQ
jgi:hypothetical protein